MARRYIDYKELKAAVPMTDVLRWFNIETQKDGNALRAECPLCQRGGDRALYITPSKYLFTCHGMFTLDPGQYSYGGDTIKLVGAVHGCSTRDAAAMIAEQFGFGRRNSDRELSPSSPSTVTVPSTKRPAAPSPDALQPLAHLSTDHEAIEALGLTVAICEAIGIGFTAKGLMRNRVAFPLRLPDGTLVGYMGLATAPDQKPLILFPKNLAEKCAAPPAQTEPEAPTAEVVDIRSFYPR